MNKNIYGTPEPSLAAELRSVLHKRNILSVKTKQKVIDALDDHISNDEDTKWAIQRSKIVNEIYTSEMTYIKQLEIIIKEFKKPVEQQSWAPISIVNSIFGNIEPIYNVNVELLKQLKKSKENIVSAFVTTAPFLKLYSVYAYNYRHIINTLQALPKSCPKLHEFIQRQECKPETPRLNSLLITPIQRIPRYILLLKELKTYTPENIELFFQLEAAIEEISSVANHIDSLVQEQENVSRMIAIQRSLIGDKPTIVVPGRKLIKEGAVKKMIRDKRSSYSRYLILLNDMILYCKEWKEPGPLKCLKVLPLNKCSVNKIVYKQDTFSLHCQSLTLTLGCENTEEAENWLTVTETTICQYIENIRSLKRKSSSYRPVRNKELSKLDGKILSLASRKRPIKDQNEENCLSSPWKKIKSCALVNTNQDSLEVKTNKPSYLRIAKQLFNDATNSIQRYLTSE